LKRKDAFIQILHEVTGMSKELIEKDMAHMLPAIPGIDDEMPDAEYEQFLNGLREDGVCF
jgi:hypothetical protein